MPDSSAHVLRVLRAVREAFAAAGLSRGARTHAAGRGRIVGRPRFDGAPRRPREPRERASLRGLGRARPSRSVAARRRVGRVLRRRVRRPRRAARRASSRSGTRRWKKPRSHGARGPLCGPGDDRGGRDRARASCRRPGRDAAPATPARRGAGGTRGDAGAPHAPGRAGVAAAVPLVAARRDGSLRACARREVDRGRIECGRRRQAQFHPAGHRAAPRRGIPRVSGHAGSRRGAPGGGRQAPGRSRGAGRARIRRVRSRRAG